MSDIYAKVTISVENIDDKAIVLSGTVAEKVLEELVPYTPPQEPPEEEPPEGSVSPRVVVERGLESGILSTLVDKAVGIGFKFPFSLWGVSGLSKGLERIRESIYLDLMINADEIYFKRRLYDSLSEFLFEQSEEALTTLVYMRVVEILRENPKIDLKKVEVYIDNGDERILRVVIYYKVKNFDIEDIVEYSFMLRE